MLFLLVVLLVGSLFPAGAVSADDPETPDNLPTRRCCMAMAYFPGPNVVILYGGKDSTGAIKNDTWRYNWSSNNWTLIPTGSNPGSRRSARMVYVPSLGKMMLFGGTGTIIGKLTWFLSYSGGTFSWAECTNTDCPDEPDARSSHGMTHDGVAGQVVVFGGQGATTVLGDTWTWDSVGHWQECTPSNCDPLLNTAPSARTAVGMAYQDSVSQHKVVLFGGSTSLQMSNVQGDTWWWNGLSTGWTKCPVLQCPAGSPSARHSHRMEYSVAAGKTLLFGGYDGTSVKDDTWLWDGAAWTACSVCTSKPSPRCCSGLAYYPGTGINKIVLFGGGDQSATPSSLKNDTWAWDATTNNWSCRLPVGCT